MTKDELFHKLTTELTPYQHGLWNYVFYWNPKYVESVFAPAKLGEYQRVWEFTLKNKDKLRMKNVPRKFKEAARYSVQSAKLLQGQKTARVSWAS